jgi:hypothetical protein
LNGQFVYATTRADPTSSDGVLWVALAEKAFVEMNLEGWMGHGSNPW